MQRPTITKWIALTKDVDEETGEIISKEETENYKLIKINKYVEFNRDKNSGIINYTKLWRRKKVKQLNLF